MFHSVVVFNSCKAQAWGAVTNTITCPKWSGWQGRWVHGKMFCFVSPWAHLLDSLHGCTPGEECLRWCHGYPHVHAFTVHGVLCHHGYYLTPWRLGGGTEKKQRDRFSFCILFISTWCGISPSQPEQNHAKVWNNFGLRWGLPNIEKLA